MTPKTKAKLSIVFHVSLPVLGAAALWWTFSYMQAQMFQPVDEATQKSSIVKREFERALRTSVNDKMDICLKEFNDKAPADTLVCPSDVQIDMAKINADADQAIAKSKEDAPRIAEAFEKMGWGMAGFYLLMMTLVTYKPIRADIKKLRAPGANPE